jgi:hypothetical protein
MGAPVVTPGKQRNKAPQRDLIDLQLDLALRGDPIRFLTAFLDLSLRRSKFEVPFDYDTLSFLAWSFGQAALAAVGHDRLRYVCEEQQRRYDKLAREMRAGEHERGEIGMTFLNQVDDWPPPVVTAGALQVLQLAMLGESAA